MKLVIKDGLVIASHNNNQDIKGLYQDCEIIWLADKVILTNSKTSSEDEFGVSLPIDPRSEWSLEENKINAKLVIEDIAENHRSQILSSMPGRIAGYEAKARIAKRIFESETPNPEDITTLQLEADNREITVLELVQVILKKNKEFSDISTYIDGEIQKTISNINSSKSYKTAWKALKNFEDNINQKISS